MKTVRFASTVVLTVVIMYVLYDITFQQSESAERLLDLFVFVVTKIYECLNWLAEELKEFAYIPSF